MSKNPRTDAKLSSMLSLRRDFQKDFGEMVRFCRTIESDLIESNRDRDAKHERVNVLESAIRKIYHCEWQEGEFSTDGDDRIGDICESVLAKEELGLS